MQKAPSARPGHLQALVARTPVTGSAPGFLRWVAGAVSFHPVPGASRSVDRRPSCGRVGQVGQRAAREGRAGRAAVWTCTGLLVYSSGPGGGMDTGFSASDS